MKKLLLTAAMSLVLLGGASSAARAEVQTYDFDKAHTQVLFFVNHLGFSNSQGEFLDYNGYFTFDQNHTEKSKIDVTIKTSSIDMDDDNWDDHLKGADFFNVEKFPDMTFKSTAIKVTGDNTANITGDLTLLGVTKPVTLNVTHNKSGTHPYTGKHVAGFSATGVVKRSEFGMNYGLPGVADDVHLRLEVEGILRDTVE